MAPTFSLLIPAIGVLLVAIGAFLFKRGRWPRRTGDTPHCRKCDYILSGAQARCPECGTAVTPAAVVRGERHRRAGLTALGAGLALFGLAFVLLFAASFTNSINWNRYKPLSWLLNDIGSSNASRWGAAWAEIQRRHDDKLLSDDDENAVVEKGLQLQAAGTVVANGKNVLDFIASRFLDHKLTSAQADRFFASALKINLSVRPVVGTKSPVPYSITGKGQGPGNWWLRMRTLETQIDDGPVQKMGGATGTGFSGWSSGGTLPAVPTPGKHRLRYKVELAADPGGSLNWNSNAPVARRVNQDLFADFQVIEGATPIVTVTEPTAAVLAPLLTTQPGFISGDPPVLDLSVRAAGLPVDVAFDVYFRFDGKEYPIGGVNFHKGAEGTYGVSSRDVPTGAPANVDVIFRTSEEIARTTVDMTQIWKGEIVLKNVPLHRPAGMQSATAPAANHP